MTAAEGWLDGISGPHQGQPVYTTGAELDDAEAAVIMIHGRGATAPSILDLANLLPHPNMSYLAPQAKQGSWYPFPFLEARSVNEPGLTSAHEVVRAILDGLSDAGIQPDRVVLLGFSQGACLATDYAALNPRRYGGIVGLSGGLIGDELNPARYQGSLDGTPAFLGCSDIDPHIPVERVHETSSILDRLEADVTTSIYPGMGHTINPDEIEHARGIVEKLFQD
ncbi:MAG: dienelactone hydrolase family protein [Thermomicrobiales bacterium]